MKTIIHVIDSLGIGGAEVLLVKTIPLLHNYNHIICYLHKPNNLEKQFIGIPVFCLELETRLDYFKVAWRLRKIIKETKASIVHSHLLWSTWVARLACPSNVPLVFTIHNVLSKDAFDINKTSLLFERLTHTKNQIAVGVSNEVLTDYDNYVGIKSQHFTLYNFIEDEIFEQSSPPKLELNNALRLVAVGNLRRQKNYGKLLEAFVYLKRYDIHLDIYGSGDLESDLQSFIDNNQINVKLKGNSSEIIRTLPAYDAFIMSSVYEGFSIALVEAMALGLPIITSNIEVIKEAVEENALFFNPDNPKDIADTILAAFLDWEGFRRKSLNNSDFIKNKSSKNQYLKGLNEIYNSALKKSSK